MRLTGKVACKIKTEPNVKPVLKYLYRMAPNHRKELAKIIDEQMREGLIEEASDGAWALRALLAKKSSSDLGFVVDLRASMAS